MDLKREDTDFDITPKPSISGGVFRMYITLQPNHIRFNSLVLQITDVILCKSTKFAELPYKVTKT